MSARVRGKTALVTGAARGIGQAAAVALNGARVPLTDPDGEGALSGDGDVGRRTTFAMM